MIKKVLIGLTLVAALFVAIGFLLPSEYRVERSKTIHAPPADVFDHIDDFPSWRAWDPWTQRDDTIAYSYEGPESGEGAAQTWRSENSGTGRIEIVESEPAERLVTEMSFDEGQLGARSTFRLEAVAGGTRVTWSMEGDMGNNPVGRWLGLIMDGMVGSDYEQGLANLARVVEGDEAKRVKAQED
ncbi:MAG: SRPBCC family protein [Myxococcota bacterium]